MQTNNLIQAIKEGKDDLINDLYTKVAFKALSEKIEEKKKEIAKTLFRPKEAK